MECLVHGVYLSYIRNLSFQFDKLSSSAMAARRGTIKGELSAGLQSGALHIPLSHSPSTVPSLSTLLLPPLLPFLPLSPHSLPSSLPPSLVPLSLLTPSRPPPPPTPSTVCECSVLFPVLSIMEEVITKAQANATKNSVSSNTEPLYPEP